MDDPDMEVEDEDENNVDEDPFEAGECTVKKPYAGADGVDVDLSEATIASLTRFLRDELVQMCEVRGIEVGGTKPQLAKALLKWVSIGMTA